MDIRVILLIGLLHLSRSEVWDLSCEEIKSLVDGHNVRRLMVAKGEVPDQPPAAKMNSMVWDEQLAEQAKEWASNYTFESNDAVSDSFTDRFKTVSTIITTMPVADRNWKYNLDEIIGGWFENYKYQEYTYGPMDDDNIYSLYPKMVWSDSIYLGCGASEKNVPHGKILYIACNYGPGGNIIGEYPYEAAKEENGVVKGVETLECPIDDCSHPYGSKC